MASRVFSPCMEDMDEADVKDNVSGQEGEGGAAPTHAGHVLSEDNVGETDRAVLSGIEGQIETVGEECQDWVEAGLDEQEISSGGDSEEAGEVEDDADVLSRGDEPPTDGFGGNVCTGYSDEDSFDEDDDETEFL